MLTFGHRSELCVQGLSALMAHVVQLRVHSVHIFIDTSKNKKTTKKTLFLKWSPSDQHLIYMELSKELLRKSGLKSGHNNNNNEVFAKTAPLT